MPDGIEERGASHLDQPPEPELLAAFHQPGEGRGVAVPVAVQVIIEVRVRIEQQNVHRPVAGTNVAPERGDGSAGDRVVSAEEDRGQALLGETVTLVGNPGDHRLLPCHGVMRGPAASNWRKEVLRKSP